MLRTVQFEPPDAGARLEDRVQAHADEIEYLYASRGETPDYLGHAAHLRTELDRGSESALLPRDPTFWAEVIAELERRDAGGVTAENADRFRLIEE